MRTLLCCALLLAAAQPLRADGDDSTATRAARWKGDGELSLTDMEGNRALSLVSTALSVAREGTTDYAATGAVRLRYGRSDGDVSVEDYYAEFGVRALPGGRLAPTLTSAFTRDVFRRIRLRVATAVAARYRVVDDGDQKFAVSVGLLQEFESRTPDEDPSDDALSLTRYQLQVEGETPLREGVTLLHRSTMQPAAEDLGDYLLNTTTSMRVALSRTLALQTSYNLLRDATPAPGVRFKSDRTLTVGLLLKLRS